jgi:hypothetical protein
MSKDKYGRLTWFEWFLIIFASIGMACVLKTCVEIAYGTYTG